jgi:hypothetical protein
MTIEKIRSFRNAHPFKPFDIVLRDGKRVHVALPERMALAPNGQMLGVYEGIMPTLLKVDSIVSVAPTRVRRRGPRRK